MLKQKLVNFNDFFYNDRDQGHTKYMLKQKLANFDGTFHDDRDHGQTKHTKILWPYDN